MDTNMPSKPVFVYEKEIYSRNVQYVTVQRSRYTFRDAYSRLVHLTKEVKNETSNSVSIF